MYEKNAATLAEIVENLFTAMPVIHRKLIIILDESTGLGISHHHFAVLGMLSRQGSLPVSEIGSRLWISRPQMTAVIDKLVALGLVSRKPDEKDRRVIHIELTSSGKMVVDQGRKTLQAAIAQKLANLTTADLETLAKSLKNINEIGARIE
jgi:DNA-binding MarR family transcriptional regulator